MKRITQKTEEKLARSLSWESTDLLPFMPYLLQDFWELGSDPDVMAEKGYDCVIFGAVGPDVLGGPAEALRKLKATVKPGGYILIEEGYIPDDGRREDVRFNREAYFHKQHWTARFKEAGLELVETASGHCEGHLDGDSGLAAITARAGELMEKHPDQKAMFEGYVRNQRDEYEDIEGSLECVTWVLRK